MGNGLFSCCFPGEKRGQDDNDDDHDSDDSHLSIPPAQPVNSLQGPTSCFEQSNGVAAGVRDQACLRSTAVQSERQLVESSDREVSRAIRWGEGRGTGARKGCLFLLFFRLNSSTP